MHHPTSAAADAAPATFPRPDLRPLFAPKSVAILGASERLGTIGPNTVDTLAAVGFTGPIWPINPRYGELYGRTCYPTIADLPAAPDVVVVAIKGSAAVAELDQWGAKGVRAAVIYDSGFAETGADGQALQAALVEKCRRYGIALCGPNCMGMMSPFDNFSAYRLPVTDAERLKGHVGLISHSGSITIGLLADTRRYGFSKAVSAGNEAVVDSADYLDFFVDDPNTKIIACFLEAIRRPAAFRAALARAADKNKPVVILKVGKSERTQRAIVSHTGGLAGSAAIFSDVLRRANAIEVADVSEMSEVLAVLSGPRWPRGRNILVATGSGGQAELMLDIAEDAGLTLPALDTAARAEVEGVVGRITGDGNPLDCWGNGDIKTNLSHSLGVVGRHQGYDAIAYCNDANDFPPVRIHDSSLPIVTEAAETFDKPHYMLNPRAGLMRRESVERLKQSGVVMISGLRQGLLALDRVGRHVARRDAMRGSPPPAAARLNPVAAETRRLINEYDGKRLLAAFGVPVPAETLVTSADEACAAAAAIGWPVVLKAVSDQVAHKTELGLVKLNLRDEATLRDALADLTARFSAGAPDATLLGMLVQPMVAGGVEVFLGLKRDPDWGLAIAFGLGGVFLEVMRDVALRTLPLEPGDAQAMIRETKAATMLAGVRGAPASDIDALAKAIEALAAFGMACGGDLVECDLNPIKVFAHGQGCVALDALIVLDRT